MHVAVTRVRTSHHGCVLQWRRSMALAALTAPGGISPLIRGPSWATVSRAWCSMAGCVSPPMCDAASTSGWRNQMGPSRCSEVLAMTILIHAERFSRRTASRATDGDATVGRPL
jgi:hypothetical protein